MQGELDRRSRRKDWELTYAQYELDSLVGFIKLSRSYYNATKDASIINDNCVYLVHLQPLHYV